jgi:hypothetical protein
VDDNMVVNMVFELLAKFWAPDGSVAELALGAQVAAFQKLEKLGVHMKPLFVKGYLQGVIGAKDNDRRRCWGERDVIGHVYITGHI